MKYATLFVLALSLSSCMPVINKPPKDIILTFSHTDGYSIREINATEAIYSVTMKMHGLDLAFNEPRCVITGILATCKFQYLKSYIMPFRGIINEISFTYMTKDGQSRTQEW